MRDNSKNEVFEMKSLKDDKSCHLLLFTVSRNEDIHWILSLEYFFEKNLHPLIKSGRNG